MSDDFHRPTLTFPSGAYNATQVRLYGLAAKGSLIYAGQSQTYEVPGAKISVELNKKHAKDDVQKALAEIKKNKDEFKIRDDQLFEYILNGKIIWPFPIPIGSSYQLPVDVKTFGSVVISVVSMLPEIVKNGAEQSCGIIVGYSYEGHCYDLPKPKIMLLPTNPVMIPVDDCGYDAKYDPNAPQKYMLWIVDKLDECVEFEMNQGFVEQLVLEANLPGKRSPTMYASKAALGHRGGKMME